MLFLRLFAVALLISSTGLAFAQEYVVVEWTDTAAAQRFSRSCGVSLEKLPVSPGSRRTSHRLSASQLESCEGLTRKLQSSSLYRTAAKELFQKLERLDAKLPLVRDGLVRTQESVPAMQLARQADQVQFFEFPYGVLKPDLNRRGFVFLAQSKKIIVNSLNPTTEALEAQNIKDGKLSALLLHEVLQAMGGYYDRYYEFSTALWLLSQLSTAEAKDQLPQMQAMASMFAKAGVVRVAGGCSLVCGGGEGNEAYFKIILLTLALKRPEFVRDPKFQKKLIWKTIGSEINEIMPNECEIIRTKDPKARCNIFVGEKGKPGLMYFVGDWLESMNSVQRTTEAAITVMHDLVQGVHLDELR